MKLSKHPPDAFHIVRVHRAVIPVHIDPAPQPLDGLPPLIGIALDGCAAEAVKIPDSHRFDIAFALKLLLLLYFVFDRQTVAVPAEPSFHELSPHRLVSRNDVFYRPGEYVAVMRQTGGERRPVIKTERIGVLPALHRSLEHVLLVPIFDDPEFEIGERLPGIYTIKHEDEVRLKNENARGHE